MDEFKSELETLIECRRDYWLRLLKHTKGSVTKAAQIARIGRASAYRVLTQMGIEIVREKKVYGLPRYIWTGVARDKVQIRF